MTKTPKKGPSSIFSDLSDTQGSSKETTIETARHALLEIDVLAFRKADHLREARQTIMIPLDEVEARLRPDQVTALRSLRPFSGSTRAGDMFVCLFAKARAIVVTPDDKPVTMGHAGAVGQMGRQERRRLARDLQRGATATLTLEVIVGSRDLGDEGARHAYSLELAELEGQLTPDQTMTLRNLQPLLTTAEVGGVFVALHVTLEAADSDDGHWAAGQSPSALTN